ncbi:PepSY domain-containing protein [Ruminococcus sp. Marseille-P6503]|uniref:PepSY domain-containing protein n=1 Tax=Ruminococcus sp. Marseille-P6503 TaxID=2364796 RepID=UPI000F54ACEB|nr:PepSY domain-containing protein [Ruminococcus sp. Marseille-P6503]
MTGIKNLFSTPKKKVISIICIVIIVLIAAAVISIIAVRSAFIGGGEAEKIALADAALKEADVSGLRARLDFDDGRFCYDVDFYSNGTEYEYSIQAKDGDIVSRDIEGNSVNVPYEQNYSSQPDSQAAVNTNESKQTNTSSAADSQKPVQTESDSSEASSGQSAVISENEAKSAALADAGLTENDVTFIKVKLDTDDFIKTYDIEFYTSDTEYDYEINAADGTVKEKSTEAFRIQTNSAANGSDNYIGVDKAKEIALAHAGLTEAEVQFSKAKLENDDGITEYDISFYSSGTEYEYTVNAVSGEIIEFDYERY